MQSNLKILSEYYNVGMAFLIETMPTFSALTKKYSRCKKYLNDVANIIIHFLIVLWSMGGFCIFETFITESDGIGVARGGPWKCAWISVSVHKRGGDPKMYQKCPGIEGMWLIC